MIMQTRASASAAGKKPAVRCSSGCANARPKNVRRHSPMRPPTLKRPTRPAQPHFTSRFSQMAVDVSVATCDGRLQRCTASTQQQTAGVGAGWTVLPIGGVCAEPSPRPNSVRLAGLLGASAPLCPCNPSMRFWYRMPSPYPESVERIHILLLPCRLLSGRTGLPAGFHGAEDCVRVLRLSEALDVVDWVPTMTYA